MSRPLTIALHTGLAAIFFFALQRFVLSSSLNEALIWCIGGGVVAGLIAYNQTGSG
jgi:hypothetical protein